MTGQGQRPVSHDPMPEDLADRIIEAIREDEDDED